MEGAAGAGISVVGSGAGAGGEFNGAAGVRPSLTGRAPVGVSAPPDGRAAVAEELEPEAGAASRVEGAASGIAPGLVETELHAAAVPMLMNVRRDRFRLEGRVMMHTNAGLPVPVFLLLASPNLNNRWNRFVLLEREPPALRDAPNL